MEKSDGTEVKYISFEFDFIFVVPANLSAKIRLNQRIWASKSKIRECDWPLLISVALE